EDGPAAPRLDEPGDGVEGLAEGEVVDPGVAQAEGRRGHHAGLRSKHRAASGSGGRAAIAPGTEPDRGRAPKPAGATPTSTGHALAGPLRPRRGAPEGADDEQRIRPSGLTSGDGDGHLRQRRRRAGDVDPDWRRMDHPYVIITA